MLRATIGGLVLFVALASAPRSVNPDVQPLLGLAEAVAAMPRPPVEASVWYSRSEQIELIEVPDELLDGTSADALGGRHLRFLLSSVHEVWTQAGETAHRQRITYGAPQFLSPEDAGLFSSANLSSHYPTQRIVESVTPVGEFGFFGPAELITPTAVSAGLRRQVAGVGERRSEELEMLRLAASIIQTHGNDPVTRASILRAIADIPGIWVEESGHTVEVSFDYHDGDRPLRLSYSFDSETAHLVRESVVSLATQAGASTVVSESWFEPVRPADGLAGS